MAYKQLLSTTPGDALENTLVAIEFLIDQLGAIQRKHPFHDNLVLVNGKSWWVIPAISGQGVDLCNGQDENPIELVSRIQRLQAGVLIFRQMNDNRLCVYEISDLDLLRQRLESSLILMWDTVEIIKSGSDIGVMIGNELIGFRKLRNPSPEPPTPMSRTIVDI